ncbi:MAG: 4-hydroxy-tetrahydrodipicolinate synthase [Planctomycetota bacterium]
MGRGKRTQPFAGSFVALPTPIRSGRLDEATLRADIETHIGRGTQGLVLTGSTGESALMSLEERRTVWGIGVDQVAGRLPILAGVGAPSTDESVRMAESAARVGVDGLLAVTPYYSVPETRGQIAHYAALAQALPQTRIVLYNVPKRTGCDLKPETVAQLAEQHANIVGIKESTRSIARIEALCRIPRLAVFAGEDLAIVDFLRRGAAGAISVIGNLLPRETAELIGLTALNPADPRVETLESRLAPLMACLTLAPNPSALKAALHIQRGYPEELRLPLVPVEPALRERLELALAAFQSVEAF